MTPHKTATTIIAATLLITLSCTPTQQQYYNFTLNNQERTTRGIPKLQYNQTLMNQTQQWAEHLAQTQTLTHSHLTPPPGTQQITENIGKGPNTQTIHNALMQSPTHRANTLNPNATQTGVGHATNGNTTYIVEQQTTP